MNRRGRPNPIECMGVFNWCQRVAPTDG